MAITYTTLTYQGTEQTLADWGFSDCSGLEQNQGEESISISMPTPIDGSDTFPYGAWVVLQIGRTASRVNPNNATLPASNNDGGSTLTFSGGTQKFWGYCIDNDRVGEPGSEIVTYKFTGPLGFFFSRLIFQKMFLTWNGTHMIADYQSDVVLGLSLTPLNSQGSVAASGTQTNLMTIAQQIKEILMFAQQDSAYQQQNNGLSWPTSSISGQPANAQFQCDQLSTLTDSINYDLLSTPSANVLLADYAGTALTGKTSASTLPSGSYLLRAPLDAANAITCKEALQRMLQWLGGLGSTVVWTDHTQTPPVIHVAPRSALTAKTLALTGITVSAKIKRRTDLIPGAVHFRYKIAGTVAGQPYTYIVNDIAATISGSQVEGVGQYSSLAQLNGTSLSSGVQASLFQAARTADAIVQTFDFQGAVVNASKCTITTAALNLVDPAGSGADSGFWAKLFPDLGSTYAAASSLRFFNSGNPGPTITNAETGATIYSGGSWASGIPSYSNFLVDGQIAPWMLTNAGSPGTPSPGQSVKARLTAYFTYQPLTQPPTGGSGSNNTVTAFKGYEEKHIDLTLTTLSSGTYYSAPSIATGEPVPLGLAGYVLALESIPQYEGSILVQEQEISDVCPLGCVLNISGGRTDWASMNACVQSIRYNYLTAQTEITFGPARHLGPAQFIQRFRNNVGPRWYNQIGGDLMNQANPGADSLGTNLPAQAPVIGAQALTFQTMPAALATDQTASSPYTLPAGLHFDSGAGNAPSGFAGGTDSRGSIAYSAGPGLLIAQGPTSGVNGESNAIIRAALNDLKNGSGNLALVTPSGTQAPLIRFREEPYCQVNPSTGASTSGFRLVLESQFYTTSIRSTPDP